VRRIAVEPLTRQGFLPFGQVIEAHPDAERRIINRGTTERFHDLARVETGGGRPTINIFRGKAHTLPVIVARLERHPKGSQSFMPLGGQRFLVVVAPDQAGTPGMPRAFLTAPGQGVSYPAGQWHSALLALDGIGDFLVVDLGDVEDNLEEFELAEPVTVGGG